MSIRIKNTQGFAPFIYITNGLEIEFWDSENYPIRKVLSYHSLEDLETYRKRNDNAIKLSPELLDKNTQEIEQTLDFMSETMQNFLEYYKPSTNIKEFETLDIGSTMSKNITLDSSDSGFTKITSGDTNSQTIDVSGYTGLTNVTMGSTMSLSEPATASKSHKTFLSWD